MARNDSKAVDVSVVIPTRNRSALLTRTLRSALRQERVAIEVIVVDEASIDETPAVLAAVGDPRLKVLRHETPRGLSSARNHGAEQACGEWLAFLDDDDLWAPSKLWRQVTVATETGREWASHRVGESARRPHRAQRSPSLRRRGGLHGGALSHLARRRIERDRAA